MEKLLLQLNPFKQTKAVFFFLAVFISLATFGQGFGEAARNAAKQGMSVLTVNFKSFSVAPENRAAWAKFNKNVSHPEFGKIPYNAMYPGYVEVLDKRQVDERYFVNEAQPTQFQVQKALGALHHRVNGEWVTIDHRIVEKGNGMYEASNQFDPVGFDTKKGSSYIKTPTALIYFNKWSLYGSDNAGNRTFLAKANWSDYTAGDDGIYVTNIFPGIDAQMSVSRGSVKTNFIVKKINFAGYNSFLFNDEYVGTLASQFKFKGTNANLKHAASEVTLMDGNNPLLEIGEANAWPQNGEREDRITAEYFLESNNLIISVPVDWIEKHLKTGNVIIDPLVTSANTLAQASITGSMYNNTPCTFGASCNYNLSVNTPANSTLTDVKWSFNYITGGVCFLSDGGIRITRGACISPAGAGLYWYCNLPSPGTCNGNNISIFSDVSACLPAPSCAPVPVAFTLQFFRNCFGAVGCSGTCIGANSPWTMTLEGRTVEFSNLVTPFTVSSNTVCAGLNLTASTGVQYGVPTRTVNWSFNPGGVPSVGTGNNPTINFPTPGTVTLYAIVTDACGITSTSSRTIGVIPIPTANAGITKSLTCVSNPTVINGSGGGTYSWTGPGAFSSSLQNPSVGTAGNYSLVVTVSACPSPVSTVQVVTNTTAPTVTATVASSLNCTNLSTQITLNTTTTPVSYITTGPGVTGGSTTSLVTVNVGGTYNYTVTGTANGCIRTGSIAVTQNTSVVSVTATASGSLNCNTSTVNISLVTNSAAVTYTTTGPGITAGSSTSLITVNTGGTYNYTVTNSLNTCKTTGAISIAQNTTPVTATATAASSLNCTTLSSQITINTSTTPLTYTTSGPGVTGGATSSVVTVNVGGTYNYTVTNSFNGCVASGSTSVVQNTSVASVTATASGSLNCNTSTVGITINSSSASVTYTTAGPGVTAGSTTSFVTVNAGGTYNYTVTNSLNTCKTTGSLSIIQNTTAPTATATVASSLNCNVVSTQITIGTNTAPVTYTTAGPGVTGGATSSVVSVNVGGTYNYTVTNPFNGCKISGTVAVTQNTTAPAPSISNSPSITCINTTVTINGNPGAGVTYTWSTGGGNIVGSANNQNVNVNAAGVYSLAVTSSSNGCTSVTSATVNVPANLVTPTITAASQTVALTCLSPTAALAGTASPGGSTYTWTSSGGGFVGGINGPTVAVTTATVYFLNSTHPVTGCTTSLSYTVIPDVNSPTVTLSSSAGTITCLNTILSTTATSNPPAGITFSWSGPGIAGSNTNAAVSATTAGVYTLAVTNTSNTCKSTVVYNLSADNAAVNPNASVTNSVNCSNASATINTAPTPTTGSYSYTWAGPAVGGATTAAVAVSPTITTVYTVSVLNPVNGCTATQVVTVTANTNPPTLVSVSPNNLTLTCSTPTAVLNATATGASSYSWAVGGGGVITASAASTASIQGAGTYSVFAIGANGCISAAQVATVIPDASAPTFTLSDNSPSITCFGSASVNVVITSTVPISSYSWSPGTNTTSVGTFTASGTYTCVITATNGCVSNAIVTVNTATTPPTMVVGSGTAQAISCTNSVVTIDPVFTPSANLSYTWTGPGIVGSANNSSVQVGQSGDYSLTVTNTLTGCSTTSIIVNVTGNSTVPSLSVTSSSSIGISCLPNTSTVTLNALPGGAGITYSWSTGATTQSITTSDPGTYSITVTDSNNGCSTSATVAVQNNTTSPSFTATAAGNLPCGAGSTTLSASSTNTDVSYNWTGAGIVSGSNSANATVNAPGIYTVTATDNLSGCVFTNTLSVSQTSAIALAVADVTTGAAPLTVNFNNLGNGASTWTLGNGNTSAQTNPSGTYTSAGTYSIVLETTNGSCIAYDTLLIKVLDGLGDIPEIFTPNGDGKNDLFVVKGLDSYPNCTLNIFNRWGNPVYNSKPYLNDWDGAANVAGKTGSGKLPSGTYYFILSLGDEANTIFRGYVQIQY